MKFVYPKVFQVGETRVLANEMLEYLKTINAEEWNVDDVGDAELLIEFYGRGCYNSFIVGNNPNVTKIREGNAEYLDNILKVNHGSVLEHAVFNFEITNVSKVFTEELVRHRVGVAISGESGRYIRREEVSVWIPDVLKNNPIGMEHIQHILESADNWLKFAPKAYSLDNSKMPFSKKKELTSAIRRFIPIGQTSNMGWSANVRAIRHVCSMRTAPGAEIEMQIVFNQIAQ